MRKPIVRKPSSDYLQSMRLWTNFFAASGAEFAVIERHFDYRDKDILEVGCGNGRLSIKLAEKASSVVGIDLDAQLVKFAADYATSNKVGNLQFAEMSALQMTFADCSFDLVLMPWMLHMLKEPEAALKEVFRVLREDGRLIVFGLWGDSDYDRLARHFVTRREQEINPQISYENPLMQVFGGFEQENLPADQSFSFIFPDCGVTVEAFNFAFKNWYDKTMSEKELSHLRHLLHSYRLGNHIELKTKGAIYIGRKN